MKRIYCLCPGCKKLLPYMIDIWEEKRVYYVVNNIAEKVEYRPEHVKTKCPECGFTSPCHAEEFEVVVDEKGNIESCGEYWEKHPLPEDIDREAVKD